MWALDNLAVELDATVGPDLQVAATGSIGVIGYVVDAPPSIERTRERPWVVHALGWCGHGIALSVASEGLGERILCDGEVPTNLHWHRDRPPHLPFEAARWAGFQAAVRLMALLDRIA